MSAPQKPWESSKTSRANQHLEAGMSSGRNILNSNLPQSSWNSHPSGTVRPATYPPPVPPRPPQLSVSAMTRPAFGMAPSMYSGYSGYSNYGGYSSFGSYPGSTYFPSTYGYGSYGQPGNAFENRFLQVAEESSRNAFQSIESLVRAFTSVSMMLESTYHAMYSSFRAVLGVVDNFSRLRQMFAQFFSAITILRIIKSFYRRLLYWLGVIEYSPQSDRIWAAASSEGTNSQATNYSSWPLFIFIGLLFGGPYLISKFFYPSTLEPKKWDPKKGTYHRTIYPHEAVSEAELSFSENEVLNVAPPELQLLNNSGWVLASNQHGTVGYVPVTRLRQHTQEARTDTNMLTRSSNVETSVGPQN